jgi:hypothetical protein
MDAEGAAQQDRYVMSFGGMPVRRAQASAAGVMLLP